MKTKSFRNVNYIGWMGIILTFLFIYFSYFFIYIPRKEAQLQQKAFRILKEYGSNMSDKQKYFENHFKNFGAFYAWNLYGKSNNDEITKLIEGLPKYVETSNGSGKTDASYIDFNDNKRMVRFFTKSFDNDSIKVIHNYYQGEKIDSLLFMLNEGILNSVPIESFMAGLKFDELFENIAFFHDNDIYYNTKSDKWSEIFNPLALSDSINKAQSGIYKKLNINGEVKHTIILPVRFMDEWIFIAGFISDSEYRSKTRTINTQLIVYIAGILLLVFFGMPVLKIMFIDPRERLKAVDAAGSGISMMFGIGLFLIIVISLFKSQVADRAFNYKRIQQISSVLVTSINTDINSVKNLAGSIISGKSHHKTELSYLVHDHFANGKTMVQFDTLNSPFKLNEIILIDPEGIVQKVYTRTPFSEVVKVNLGDRQYFKNAVDINQSWSTNDSLNLNFYIESIRSYNTLEVETAVSFHTEQFGNLPVMAITSKIPSLYNQVLPGDIEFVIIDKSGKVLYHTKEDKNLHENFIQESESNYRLVHAINSDIEDIFRLNYDGQKWLAKIIPIDNTPLFHITLLDLNQSGNLNARIFLFTFYYYLFSLIFLIAVLLSISAFQGMDNDSQKNSWIFGWIVLKPCKYPVYKALIAVLSAILIAQFAGIYLNDKPDSNLVFQLIFILYTLVVSITFLSPDSFTAQKFKKLKFVPVAFILLISIVLILILLNNLNLVPALKYPVILIILIQLIIPLFLKYFPAEEITEDKLQTIPETKVRNTYLAFLFLWLASLSAMPVVQYYFSIKKYENSNWQNEQILTVARKNIGLYAGFSDHNSDWIKRIQGNNIDSMHISFKPVTDEKLNSVIEASTNRLPDENIYTWLPDPLAFANFRVRGFDSQNYASEWFTDNVLYFKQGGTKGAISVTAPDKMSRFAPYWYVLLIIFIFAVIVVAVWLLLHYLATVILNLKQENPFRSKNEWLDMINDKKSKRILLNSFDGEYYLAVSQDRKSRKTIGKILHLHASQLISPDFKLNSVLTDSSEVIWINGFKTIINQPDNHEKITSAILELNQKCDKKIVLDLPFEVDFIIEFYDDYIASAEFKPEDLSRLYLLKKKWMLIFDGYVKYKGYLGQNQTELSHDNLIDSCFENCRCQNNETHFNEIWSNLTCYEKIVLHDLACDGLLNRKNTEIIQNLIDKRLIIPYPETKLFSGEFSDFVRRIIKTGEIKSIEAKLGLKGRWHNARYLILLIIIPLTAFVLISQGLSIEKIFGIFAGGIAAFSGLMRLFDSSFFNQG